MLYSNGTKSLSECQQKDSQSKDFGTYKIEGGQKKGYGPENHKTDKVVISYAKKKPTVQAKPCKTEGWIGGPVGRRLSYCSRKVMSCTSTCLV